MLTLKNSMKPSLLVAGAFLAGVTATPIRAEKPAECGNELSTYQNHKIEKISITSPLYFFPAANHGLAALAQTLPMKPGDAFDTVKYSLGGSQITTTIRTTFVDGFSAMRFVVTEPRLESCTAESVQVHYIVYTSVFPPLSGSSFEARQNALQRPATTGGQMGTTGRFLFVPDFQYNHTRRGYGGMSGSLQMPTGLFDRFDYRASASSNSLSEAVGLGGKRNSANQFLNQFEWRLLSTYSDLPAGAFHLKEGKLAATVFASSKAFTPSSVVLHFGGSLAGGHQQGATEVAPNSSYGDLKFVGGLEGQSGSAAFAAAYGLQLGSTLQNRTVDFAKHILDVRYNVSWLPRPKFRKPPDVDDRPSFVGRDHRPLTFESRFNAGYIQRFGQVPSTERFFGGNQLLSPFIDGQPWDIRGEPYIRSIPENDLGSLHPSFGFGGTRFYSANFTFGKAVYGKALLPRELGTPDFVSKVEDFAIPTAKGELSDTYFGQDPQVKAPSDDVSAIREQLNTLKSDLASLNSGQTATPLASILKSLTSDVNVALLTAKGIVDQKRISQTPIFMNTQLPKLTADLDKLTQALAAPDPGAAAGFASPALAIDRFRIARNQLDHECPPDDSSCATGARQNLVKHWQALNATAARQRADARASKDFAVAERALDTFLYQLNVYSVAPVAVFDIARVWPSGVGTRYAIGGGVRLSLVSVNFTAGYAVNPSRLPGEGPGALFFKLDVTNLFH